MQFEQASETHAADGALPRIGQPAPDFEAVATTGLVRLSDYRGRWLILLSNPANFKPVGTTELIAFSEIYPDLQKRGVDLVGLAIDSVYSHIAWLRDIQEKFGVEVPFPIIADLDRRVATLYRMTLPGEWKVEIPRWAFFIDATGTVRAMIQHPVTCGRNTTEILRVVDSLHLTEAHHVATPANWVPGAEIFLPSPKTSELAKQRVAEHNPGTMDWYLAKRPAPTSAAPSTPDKHD